MWVISLWAMATSCTMMHQDLDGCPVGLYLTFAYDYNLERADMFNDHVGSVTVYVYDSTGHYVTKQEEVNTETETPLASSDYRMHLDLPEGKYQLLVVAHDKPYEETLLEGANFVRDEPQAGDRVEDFSVRLEGAEEREHYYRIDHQGEPLDALWMGRLLEEDGVTMKTVEVYDRKPTYDTVSLVRDTKRINITLRELDKPETMDIADFDLKIYDRNAHILWDNSLDEQDTVYYTPYATWNTEDRPTGKADGTTATGRMAHAEFMTSRILYHERAEEDAVLSVVNRETGVEVIRVNLADLLSRMASSTANYTPQEFLDRGHEYQLAFFLQGDRWRYAQLSISVLSWSMRIENVEL